MDQCGLETRADNPPWYGQGMQLFAFKPSGSLKFSFNTEEEIKHSSSNYFNAMMITILLDFIGFKFNKTEVTWNVLRNSKSMSRDTVKQIMQEAFDKWAAECSLTFKRVSYTKRVCAHIERANLSIHRCEFRQLIVSIATVPIIRLKGRYRNHVSKEFR